MYSEDLEDEEDAESSENSEDFGDDFDEMGLVEYLRQNDDIDGLTIEEALSEGLLDIDDLPWESSNIESQTWTNEEIEALDSVEF